MRRTLSCLIAALTPHLCSAQCGPEWSGLDGGCGDFGGVDSFATFDEGRPGPAPLFCGGGQFVTFGGVPCRYLARWDGWEASPLEPGIESEYGSVKALLGLCAPTGLLPAGLYAAGELTNAGGVPVNNLARWDGQAWHDVGGGITFPKEAVYGFASCIFDEDGDGPIPPCLFVGGQFQFAGGVPAMAIARWDGQTWTALGKGLSLGNGSHPNVFALAVYDDGRGPALYVGGSFYYADGEYAINIARWDGKNWEPLGGPVGGLNGTVEALCVYDEDGDGPKQPVLFAGGQFSHARDKPVQLIARWDGTDWSDVGGFYSSGVITSLAVLRSGDDKRENLYIGGNVNILPDGTEVLGIARWNGEVWRQADYGVGGFGGGTGVDSLGVFDEDGDGPNPGGLYAGGLFNDVGTKGVQSHGVGRWGCPLPPECEADLDRSGSLDLFDFLAYLNLFNAADPAADCDASGALDLFDFLCFVNAFNAGC